MAILDYEVVNTAEKIDATVIWLHGLGANGHDFVPLIPYLQIPSTLGVRFIFPHAPSISITIDDGMVMPSWYDIYALDINAKIDTAGIVASAKAIHQLIDREIEGGIDSEKIVLAGFSQGGAVILEAGLTYPKPLAALLSLSSYFATHQTIEPNPANRQISISFYQGEHDDLITPEMAQRSLDYLQQMGYQTRYLSYPMGHEVHPKQLQDISAQLQKHFRD